MVNMSAKFDEDTDRGLVFILFTSYFPYPQHVVKGD